MTFEEAVPTVQTMLSDTRIQEGDCPKENALRENSFDTRTDTRRSSDVPALKAVGLTKRFGKGSVTALNGVDLIVPSGGLMALIGPDGAGKTTFLRMACGLLTPDAGSLEVLGMDCFRQAEAIQSRISYMPQRFGLYEDLTVRENMELYARLHGVPADVQKKRFDRLLEMTDLARFTSRQAGKLSGGMKQKLGLACSLVRSPDLLVLDEPSVGVDPLSRRDLWAILLQMVEAEHLTVLVSTAYMDEAGRCGKAAVFYEGRILACDDPRELAERFRGLSYRLPIPKGMKARTVQARMLDCPQLFADAVPEGDFVHFVLEPGGVLSVEECLRKAGLPEQCEMTPPRLEDAFMLLLQKAGSAGEKRTVCTDTLSIPQNGRESENAVSERKTTEDRTGGKDDRDSNSLKPTGEVIIEVSDLVRKFGDFVAVDRTSFQVMRGEVFGLLGPNGAGKTTTFRMLCGLLPATSGFLNVAGENLRRAPAQARGKVGYVAQKFSLYGNLTVLENLLFFGGVYGISPLELRRRIEEGLEKYGLKGHEDEIGGTMPNGFKQRLSMLVGLLHRPEILFLDEPTSGIDPLARRSFWRSIAALAEQGTTIVVTTHFMDEAEYCDRMVIQDAGRILALGTPAEVRRQGGNAALMEEAFIRIVERSRSQKLGASGTHEEKLRFVSAIQSRSGVPGAHGEDDNGHAKKIGTDDVSGGMHGESCL